MVLRCSGKVGVVVAMSFILRRVKHVEIIREIKGRILGLQNFQLERVVVIVVIGSHLLIKAEGLAFYIVYHFTFIVIAS